MEAAVSIVFPETSGVADKPHFICYLIFSGNFPTVYEFCSLFLEVVFPEFP